MTDAAVTQLQAKEQQRRLSKAELLQPRIVEKEVPLESMGGAVVVLKSLSHAERQMIRSEAGLGTPEWDEEKFTMLSIVTSLVDPKLEMSDLDDLKKQNAGVIDELVTQITFLNMLGQAGELKKESSEIPS